MSDDEAADGDAVGDETAEDDRTDPFADLDAAVDRTDDPFADLGADDADDPEAAFESVDVGEVPIEEVWKAVEEGPTDDDGLDAGDDVAVGATAEPVGDGEHVVPKDSYCERCPYLAAPPHLACDHEETTIVAVEDDDHFRVRNCPMVERGGAAEE